MAALGLGPSPMIIFYLVLTVGHRATLLSCLPVSVGLRTVSFLCYFSSPIFLCILFCFPEARDRSPASAS